MNRVRFAYVLAIAACALAFGVRAAVASPGRMTCVTGWCHWGYNYMGPSVNEIVTGGSNYWATEGATKNSGGTVYIGFGPSGCHQTLTGTTFLTWTPSDIGCGGYINPFGQYASGATSYLYFESHT